MKTLNELFEILGKATNENGENSRHWFIDFSGHVNKMSLRYFRFGWSIEEDVYSETIQQTLNEDGIQALYWFVATRLKENK